VEIVGIKEYEQNTLSVYPNPSSGIFYIELPTLVPLSGTYVSSVYNTLGKKIFSEKDVLSDRFEVDLRLFTTGIYLMQLTGDGVVYSTKLVKE
jgi:hypothetical protein